MHEHEVRVGIDCPDRVQRKDVVRAFEHPSARPEVVLEVLEEAFVEAVGLE